jgi:M-phase inducer tyrosine phosphatase
MRPGPMRVDLPLESPKASAMPLTGSPGLGDFFGSDTSPDGKTHQVRGVRDETMIGSGTESSPGSVIDSPSNPRMGFNPGRAFEKSFSCGGVGSSSLYGSRAPTNLASRRREPYNKRPLLIATNTAHEIPTHTATASALPVMDGKSGQPASIFSLARVARTGGQPPMRRAHSVCHESEGGEAGRDHGTTLPAAAETLATGRVVSHIETGTSGLQAIHHLGGRLTPDKFGSAESTRSPYAQAGLLGFGANEMEGKVLPCHNVKEDGLVRVTRETVSRVCLWPQASRSESDQTHLQVRDLIEGQYSQKISRYHIIDCRFGYEYEGGHIDGALNVNSNAAVEDLLLKDGQGVHARGHELPRPSRSGEVQNILPAIIIFHCEFSNKRAPAL